MQIQYPPFFHFRFVTMYESAEPTMNDPRPSCHAPRWDLSADYLIQTFNDKAEFLG